MTTLAPTAPRAQLKKLNLGQLPAPNVDSISAAINDYAERNNVPSIVLPSERKAEQAPAAVALSGEGDATNVTPLRKDKKVAKEKKTAPAPTKRLPLDFPEYLHRAIRTDAAQKGVSAKHIVMLALKEAGYTIREADLIEDGRGAHK